MKAIVVENPGKESVLRLEDVPAPELVAGSLRVRVAAAARTARRAERARRSVTVPAVHPVRWTAARPAATPRSFPCAAVVPVAWAATAVVLAVGPWGLVGLLLALNYEDWNLAHVAKWQGLLNKDGTPRVTSTRTGIALTLAEYMVRGPTLLARARRARKLRRHGKTTL